jgi:hypothetical protein
MDDNINYSPHIGMWSVLDAERWKKMTEAERKNFIIKNANSILPKLIHMDLSKESSDELKREYIVSCVYTLLSSHYEHKGAVMVSLFWSRAGHAKIQEISLI